MQSILEDLFHGRLHPNEALYPQTPQYAAERDAFLERQRALLANFSPEQSLQISRLMDEHNRVYSHEVSQAFVDGFRLGVQILLQALEPPCPR